MAARSVARRLALSVLVLALAASPFARPGEPAAPGGPAAPGRDTATTSAPPSSPADTAGDPRARTGCDLLAEYLGEPRPAPGQCPALAGARGVWTTPRVDPPAFVVLPDPIDSRLDWAFDGGLEAVRRAYERSGYVLDRFWLPWAVDADTLHGARHDHPDSGGLRAAYPGVLLFRRLAPAHELDSAARVRRPEVRLVYVLGEVATGGITPRAFDRALTERGRVVTALGASARGRPDTLRLVGPVFSGSVRSIVAALARWTAADATRHATIVSGGATAASNKIGVDATAAGRRVAASPHRDTLQWTSTQCVVADPQPRVDFWATANPVDSLLAVTRRLLSRELGIAEREVAVLRESSTAFGAAAGGPGAAGQPRPRGTARPGDCAEYASASSSPDWLELPVPMNIARLRGGLFRTLSSLPPLPGAPQSNRTEVDLQDPATARENLPALSSLSAPAAERTLEDIAQTLIAHRVRAVVVVATDVRDRVFLANEVRTRLRDVKVIVIGAHSLYLRPEVNQTLRGTLVVSTYPVFLESQFWDARGMTGRQRFAFTGDLAAGTFNAALYQLGEGARMVDYTAPLAGLDGDDTATGSVAARTPPVWVTVVGRGALLPVRAESLGWAPAGPAGTRADRAEAHWYVVPRPARALAGGGGAARAATAVARTPDPPGEVVRADVTTVDDWLLAVLLAGAAASAFAGFRLADGAAPLGFGSRARAQPLPARWLAPAPRATDHAGSVAAAAHIAALRRDRTWCHPLLELELHAIAWTLLRHAALLGTVVPVMLVLCRGRIHGAAAATLPAWGLGVVAALLGSALVHEDAARVRALAKGYGRGVVAGLAVRPALVALTAVAYAALSTRLGVEVLAGADLAGAPMRARAGSAVFAARALQLGSGVSPLLPLFVGGLLLLASAAWHLARVRQLREVTTFEAACTSGTVAAPGCPGSPMESAPVPSWRQAAMDLHQQLTRTPRSGEVIVGSARAFATAVRGLRAQLIHLVPTPAGGLLVLLLLVLVGWMALHIERTPETLALGPALAGRALPSTFDLLFRFVLAAALTLGAWTLFRFVGTWAMLRRCLHGVATTGLVPAFVRLPRLMPELSRLTPFSTPAKPAADAAFHTVGREGWAELARTHAVTAAALRAGMGRAAHEAAPDAVTEAGDGLSRPGELPLPLGCNEPARVRALAAAYGVLFRAAEYATLAPDDATAAPQGPPPAGSARAAVQELAALYVVDYVEWVVRHLRRLAFGVVATLVLATVLLSSYPFEPQSLVRAALFVLMAGSVAALLTALVQMNRDTVLSAITHTDPGKVTWDGPFVLNLVLVGAVPALTLLGTQFPEVRDFLFSWVTPILRTVGRN